jgi:hypothetical protein
LCFSSLNFGFVNETASPCCLVGERRRAAEAVTRLSAALSSTGGRARIDANKWEEVMAVNVHNGEVGKVLLYIAGFVGFIIVALTWVPEWISPDSANITGNTGSTARMIQ